MIVTALLALLPGLGLAPRATDARLADFLEGVRQATGYPRLQAKGPLELLGQTRYLGDEGDYRLVLAPDGRFRTFIGGRLGEILGYDGSCLWRQERIGSVHELKLEELDRNLLVTWVQSGHWLHEPYPLSIRWISEPTRERGGVLELGLQDAPMRMQLELDAGTRLPSRLIHRSESGQTTWSFEEYLDVEGFRFPRLVRVRAGSSLEDRYEISSASWVQGKPELFEKPTSTTNHVRFDPQVPARVEMERTFTGHLLVQPQVNGKHVGWFLLDSGAAAMVIDGSVADELEMPAFGEVLAVGGSGRAQARFREASEITLGPMTLERPYLIELDIAFLSSIFGVEVAGICGYDVFAQAVVEMEPASDYAAIHDPEAFELVHGSWQELILDERIPCVKAAFEGDRSGLFKIDTGANGTVTFHAPAVDRLELLEGRELKRAKTGGVGGFGEVLMGDLEWFSLGQHRFQSPTVAFSRTEIGGLADPYTLGNLGQDFLSEFRLTFDYRHGRLAFAPRH